MARRERRLRIRRRPEVPSGQARMNPSAMNYLGITDRVEVVIAGKKRFHFRVLPLETVPENEVWCNEDDLRMYGIADNTVATVRAPLSAASQA